MEEDTTAQPEVTARFRRARCAGRVVGKPIPLRNGFSNWKQNIGINARSPITFGDVDILDASATDPWRHRAASLPGH